MVCAALLRALVRQECCFCSSRFKFVTLNPFYAPSDKNRRQDLRRRELNIWLASTADDLDLISDWWFFWVTFDDRGGFDDSLTLVLFIFTCLGSITWLLEIVHVAFIRPSGSWAWLPILILILEDIPQVVITLIIQDRFGGISSLGLFNIMTSLYSLAIRLFGELFVNYCYCCERMSLPEDVQ
jgi:hypothetical protein